MRMWAHAATQGQAQQGRQRRARPPVPSAACALTRPRCCPLPGPSSAAPLLPDPHPHPPPRACPALPCLHVLCPVNLEAPLVTCAARRGGRCGSVANGGRVGDGRENGRKRGRPALAGRSGCRGVSVSRRVAGAVVSLLLLPPVHQSPTAHAHASRQRAAWAHRQRQGQGMFVASRLAVNGRRQQYMPCCANGIHYFMSNACYAEANPSRHNILWPAGCQRPLAIRACSARLSLPAAV